MNKKQTGFALIETLLIILILAVVGFGGYYVWHNQKSNAKSSVDNTAKPAQQSSQTQPPSSTTTLTLSGKTVSFEYPKSEWVADTNVPDGPGGFKICGQGVTSAAQCKDYTALYLAKEGITDSDHFYVSIGVFDTGSSVTAKDFLDYVGASLLNEDGTPATTATSTVNGRAAYYQQANYGTNEQRLAWAILGNNEGVLVEATLFKGDHYSFKTSNDYFGYKSDVQKIVDSLKISD